MRFSDKKYTINVDTPQSSVYKNNYEAFKIQVHPILKPIIHKTDF